MRTDSIFPNVTPIKLERVDDLEDLDFMFTLDELVSAQKQLAAPSNT